MKPILNILSEIGKIVDSARPLAEAQGKVEFWQRDKTFLDKVRDCILSDERDRFQWAFDQMRNLSQGFGSYCEDRNRLNGLLDKLFEEFKQLLIARH